MPIKKYVSPPDLEHSLFESTSREAGHVAARCAGYRYRQILSLLSDSPACIFAIAQTIGCFDHQISGRFGELVKANAIARTGRRRIKSATGCHAEEYAITLTGLVILAAPSSNPLPTEVE